MSGLRYGEYILVHRLDSGRVAELVLNRPDRMNAVSAELGASLAAATADLADDPSVGVTVITSSSERAFCVGADLKERRDYSEADRTAARPGSRAVYAGVLALPMPVIAAVAGYALGGGYEIALSCDVIVADPGATVGLPETTVGVIPGGGGTSSCPGGWARPPRRISSSADAGCPPPRPTTWGWWTSWRPRPGPCQGARPRPYLRRQLTRGAPGGQACPAAGTRQGPRGGPRRRGRRLAHRRALGRLGRGRRGLQRQTHAGLARISHGNRQPP